MKKLSIILCAVFLLNGCTSYIEVNDKSFVIALGVDEAENGLLKFSFLFTSPEVSGNESSGGEKPKEKDIVTVEAPTVYSAMRLMNTFKSKITDISHMKLIVFSEKIAKKGIGSYITDFVNTRGFRSNIYLCVAQGDAEDFFHEINPKQDVFIEKYIERLLSKYVSDDVNEAYLYYTYFNLCTGRGGGLLPLVGVAKEKNMENIENDFESVIPDDFSANYTAEEIPVKEKDKAVLCGYAAFSHQKMVGTLGLTESDLARMVTFNYPYGDFSVYYPPKKKYVSVHLHQTQKPCINVTAGDQAKIDIAVNLWYETTGINNALSTEADYYAFNEYLNTVMTEKFQELMQRTTKEFGADIFHFGNNAKKNFLTNDQWLEYKWDEKYKTALIVPTINVELRNFGELRYSPSRKEA